MNLSAIVQFIMALPKLIDFARQLMKMIEDWQRRQEIEKAKEAVDHTTASGDQRREEEVMGGDGGPTKNPLPGLQERPIRKR